VLSFPHHHGSGGGRIWLNGFSYGLLQLDKGYPLPAVVHLDGSLLPFADQSLALRRSIALLPRPQLQKTAVVPDHPVVADRALGLQAENLTQFAGGRLPSVIILRLGRRPGKASVVLWQILFFQILVGGFIAVDLLPPQLLDEPILMNPVDSLHTSLGVSRQLRHYETLKDNDSVSFILIIPGTDVSLNC
jgi:hypothetical protein